MPFRAFSNKIVRMELSGASREIEEVQDQEKKERNFRKRKRRPSRPQFLIVVFSWDEG